MDNAVASCLQMGNYNLYLEQISRLPEEELCCCLERVRNIVKARNIADLWLQKKFVSILNVEAQTIPKPHQIVIPYYSDTQKEAGLLLPDFTYSATDIKQDNPLFRDSLQDAADALQPILWGIAPFAYQSLNNYSIKLFMPGGAKFQAETRGRSAGLGFLIAMLQCVTSLSLQKFIAVTGVVDGDKVKKVDHLLEKVDAIRRERGDVDYIIVPHENHQDYQKIEDKNKIRPVKTVHEALEICFGQGCLAKATLRNIQADAKSLLEKAINWEHDSSHHHKADRQLFVKTRKMFEHLTQALRAKEDTTSRELWIKATHHLGKTYDNDPEKQREYLEQAWQELQKLKKDGLLRDAVDEEWKILTSFSSYWTHTFCFKKALDTNKEALELQTSQLTRLENISNMGQIFLHQQNYSHAEKCFQQAYELNQKAKEATGKDNYEGHEGIERQLSYLLKLYSYWEKWDEGLKTYQKIPPRSISDYLQRAKIEFLASWKILAADSFRQHLHLEEVLQSFMKRESQSSHPAILCYLGLLSLAFQDIFQATEYLEKSTQRFCDPGILKTHKLGYLLSIVPFVWQQYVVSQKAHKNSFTPQVVQTIQDKMAHYQLNELKRPLESHLKGVTKIGDDMDKLKSWCHGFRKLICW